MSAKNRLENKKIRREQREENRRKQLKKRLAAKVDFTLGSE